MEGNAFSQASQASSSWVRLKSQMDCSVVNFAGCSPALSATPVTSSPHHLSSAPSPVRWVLLLQLAGHGPWGDPSKGAQEENIKVSQRVPHTAGPCL